MKKKILNAVMLSTVVLSAVATISVPESVTTVKADSIDSKIAAQDAAINNAQGDAAQAKAEMDSVQSQVNSVQSQIDDANSQLKQLTSDSAKTSSQVITLGKSIQSRQKSLAAQARSAQTNGGVTSYINTIINAKSITDAVQKVTAMTQVVSANNNMMKQQQQDQKNLQDKLTANQKAYDKITELQTNLTAQQADLATQQAQYKVASLSYQATVATSSDQKNDLLAQKDQATQAAQEKAQAQQKVTTQQAAAKTQQTAPAPHQVQPAPPTPIHNSTPAPTPIIAAAAPVSSGNPYPWGQCTWGVWQILGGNMPTYSGNAMDWAVYANSGLAAGTIAVFPPGVDGAGGIGHVAVVTGVNGDGTFNVSEANFSGNGGGLGIISSRSHISAAGVSFIRP